MSLCCGSAVDDGSGPDLICGDPCFAGGGPCFLVEILVGGGVGVYKGTLHIISAELGPLEPK